MAIVYCPKPNFTGEPQTIASMCWFAGYTMLFRWKGMEERAIKPHIWNTLKDAGIDVDKAKAEGLMLKDNRKAAKALGLGSIGFGQPVSVHNIREVLKFSPCWAAGQWFSTSNHVYVIVGVSDTEAEFYDPWYDISPDEALTTHKRPLEWILNGDGKSCKGLANTFQWYPLQYVKSSD